MNHNTIKDVMVAMRRADYDGRPNRISLGRFGVIERSHL